MLENRVGRRRLQSGLRKYLVAHAMGNADDGRLGVRATGACEAGMDGMLNTVGVPAVPRDAKKGS